MTWVPVDGGAIAPAEYDARVGADTLLVSACHGYYLNGVTQDIGRLATLCHEQGAMLYVDAYQTLGAVPVDVTALGVDFLASGNLKYLMGIPGVAFLYVRRELIERLHPFVTGWFGRDNPFAFQVNALDWSSTASRFDTGTPPVIRLTPWPRSSVTSSPRCIFFSSARKSSDPGCITRLWLPPALPVLFIPSLRAEYVPRK